METRRILRLYNEGKSLRFIAEYLGISRNTITKYIHSFHVCGLSYDEIMSLTDKQMDEVINPAIKKVPDKLIVLQKLFPKLDKALKIPGMTKLKLWEDYRQEHPEGYSSTQFYHYYNLWKKSHSLTLHMTHQAGDKMFVDYTGKKLHIVRRETNERVPVEVFVAVLGASQYTYVEASWSQKKEDFITSVENAILFYGGAPQAIVPDNLRSAVSKSNRYEPIINATFKDFADHYRTIVYPTRIRKPKDKSLVENAVKIIYTRIFVPLHKKVFYDMESLNEAILHHLEVHNNMVHTSKRTSRKDLFEHMEKKILKPLPGMRYQLKDQVLATVNKGSHIYLPKDKHYYSVPHPYVGLKVKVIYSQDQVDIYHKYTQIAEHKRDRLAHHYTTNIEHLPEKYRSFLSLSPERLVKDAEAIGSNTKAYILKMLSGGGYPDQLYRSCSGVINLSKKVGNERLEKACIRASQVNQYNYSLVKTILERGLDRADSSEEDMESVPDHRNIRGKENYQL